MEPALAPVAAAARARSGPLTYLPVALLLGAAALAFTFMFQGWQQGSLMPRHPGKEAYVDLFLVGGLALNSVQTWRLLRSWPRSRLVLVGVMALAGAMKAFTACIHLSEWLGG